jgi:Fe2+ or Zn2+ uptake regulation protein
MSVSHGELQRSVLAYLRMFPAGDWVTLQDVIFAVLPNQTRSSKSSVRRTVGGLADAGLVEHEKGSHLIRLVPSARA